VTTAFLARQRFSVMALFLLSRQQGPPVLCPARFEAHSSVYTLPRTVNNPGYIEHLDTGVKESIKDAEYQTLQQDRQALGLSRR
jgi:hypothetical protein